jgi:hypothetical protein
VSRPELVVALLVAVVEDELFFELSPDEHAAAVTSSTASPLRAICLRCIGRPALSRAPKR